MLRIIQNSSSGGAKSYFSTTEYYSEGQELLGQFRGLGAERLGLSGVVTQEAWDAFCENRDPRTGRTLTARQNAQRRVGWDFNFHVPKSVSLLYAMTQDDRILDAFRESVDATMRDMQSEVQTRVRVDGRNEDRTTGNMVWGEFVHLTARPVNGLPDPHLHAHCFCFNVTFDPQENRWKAAQIGNLKRDAPYFEAAFHSRMARKMEELGISTVRTRTGWEIAGLDRATLDKFSRRTAQIEALAKEKGLTGDKKDGLGATTREHKQKDLSMPELRQLWSERLTPDETNGIAALAKQTGERAMPEEPDAAKEAVDAAILHCFERQAVVPERVLLAEALKRGVGKSTQTNIEEEFKKQDLIRAERDGRRVVTTPEVLAEEQRMIDFAREGRGIYAPLAPGEHAVQREWLNGGQRRAVEHVLHSRDSQRQALQRHGAQLDARDIQSEVTAPRKIAARFVLRKGNIDCHATRTTGIIQGSAEYQRQRAVHRMQRVGAAMRALSAPRRGQPLCRPTRFADVCCDSAGPFVFSL